MPAHAWPVYPDYRLYPELPRGVAYWWHWYEMRGTNVRAVVYEVAGDISTDALATFAWRKGYPKPPQFVRVVAEGSRDAMLAAFRLLTTTPPSSEEKT